MSARLLLFSILLLPPLSWVEAKQQPETQETKNTKSIIKEDNKTRKLASIQIIGVDNELKKNILLHMPVTTPNCDAHRSKVKLFFTTVKKSLRTATRALGYYDATFRSGGVITNSCWKLRLKIKPGFPTKITSQSIQIIGKGRTEPLFQDLLTKLPYKVGDVFNHQYYSNYKTKLSETAQSLGYFDAEFINRSIKVDPSTQQAQLILTLDTKTRFRYGKITIQQNVLSKETLNKYLLIKENELYITEDLIKQQQLLQQSGYFKLINIDTLHDRSSKNHVPIMITLIAKKRNGYKFKVGYGSDTGGRTSIEMDRRWTGDSGKKLKASAQLAQNLSGISLQLIDPKTNPEDNSLIYNIDWKIDKNDDITSQNINIGGKLIRKNQSNWVQSISTAALLDETQVEGEQPIKSKLLLFGLGLEKTVANKIIYPDRGWNLSLALKIASQKLLSDQSFTQLSLESKAIENIGNFRFVGRIQLGATLVQDFNRLPKSLRFFAGGGNSVRGYNYESLGEVNTEGKVTGGKNLLNLSLEAQYPITLDWSAAAFIDAGNAFNNWDDYKVFVGVGFGARWKSPIGPVRLDIGFPKENYKKPNLHLNIGADL